MKDFIKKLFSKEWKFSSFGKIDNTIKNFSITEKSLFYFFVVVLAIIVFIFLAKVSNLFLVEIPVQGGTLNEGVVGSPRFINPILALNDADRDLTSLIYSGLLKATPEGRLVPDLASDYNISDNGLMYTFNIKANAKFHDGADVTADDVVFTIQRLQDATLKSPKRASWDGIIAAKVSDKQVTFTLKQPYSPFLENTTIGILPKHIWKD
ncbi:MAG: ABC transporter substrate-binding protein, partial [Candidatus Paceibacterota bacterium]